MKPLAYDIKRYGSLGGDEVAMTFDENSIAHIMSVLTDLYSDSTTAIIREYSTNAYDSHVEAGQTRPIEVTLPSLFDMNLVIQDWGVGMSRHDIVHTYSKYGASTKRDTDEQSGTLGLGAKSALAYTSQFTVAAIKDGVKTVINVSRAENGSGVMEMIDSVSTDEPNGVKVVIPVSDYVGVARRAVDFFKYWKPGTVLVDGKEPDFIEGIKIADDMLLVEAPHDVVVMGNVPYRIDMDYSIARPKYRWDKDSSVVVWVPIGSVAFTPNREDLRYTKQTKIMLDHLRSKFVAAVQTALAADIDKADTKPEALKRYNDAQEKTSTLDNVAPIPKWRGIDIPGRWEIKGIEFDPNAARYSTSRFQYRVNIDDGNYYVSNWSGGSLTTTQKKKIRYYIETNNIVLGYRKGVCLVDEQTPLDDWFDPEFILDWNEIKDIKLPRNSSGGGVYGSIPVKKWNGQYWEEVDKLDPDLPVWYMSPTEDVSAYWLNNLFDADDQVVVLGKNRWAKLKRQYPTARYYNDAWTVKRQEFLDNVPDDVLRSLRMKSREYLKHLDPDKVDDPKLAEHIRLAKIDVSGWSNKFNLLDNGTKPFKSWGTSLAEYELLNYGHVSMHHKHLYIYINAVYHSKER